MPYSNLTSVCRFASTLMSAAVLAGAAYAADPPRGTVDRMYVLECGESKTNDVSNLVAGRQRRGIARIQRQLLFD